MAFAMRAAARPMRLQLAKVPQRNSTGATFPPIKTGRPDVGELSRGQNEVRAVAAEVFPCNTTPTWQKGKTDGTVNMIATAATITAFCLIGRNVYDLTTDSHKIEGK